MIKRSIAAVGILFCLAAFAAEAPHFLDLDADRDGYLTPEEVGMIDGLQFEIADIDRDGKLDAQEYDDAVSG